MRTAKYEIKGFNPEGHCILTLPYTNLKDLREEYTYWYRICEETYLIQRYALEQFNVSQSVAAIKALNLISGEIMGEFGLKIN